MFFVAAFLVLFFGRWLSPVDHAALSVAAPFQSAISAVTSGVGDGISGFVNGPGLRQQNADLKKTVALLMRENAQYQATKHENQILRRMVGFLRADPKLALLPARVIGSLNDALSPISIISRGTRDGLTTGMTVLDQNGYLVGSIVDLGSNWAKVEWILNPSSSVAAMDVTTRATGLVDGKYDAMPVLDDVPTSAVLHRGDLVVTSGLWNLYPRTLMIGQITSIRHSNSSMFQSAVVQPLADFSDLEIVQVVKNFDPRQSNAWLKP